MLVRLLRTFSSVLTLPIDYFLARPYAVDDFAPHKEAGFEGFYTRVLLDGPPRNGENNGGGISERLEGAGGTLAVIFCWVKNAKRNPHLVHVSYTPPSFSSSSSGSSNADIQDVHDTDWRHTGFKHEFFPTSMSIATSETGSDGMRPFQVTMQDAGTMSVSSTSIAYDVSAPVQNGALKLKLDLGDRAPWFKSSQFSGPMGILARLSAILPCNWHVWSTASTARCQWSSSKDRSKQGSSWWLAPMELGRKQDPW